MTLTDRISVAEVLLNHQPKQGCANELLLHDAMLKSYNAIVDYERNRAGKSLNHLKEVGAFYCQMIQYKNALKHETSSAKKYFTAEVSKAVQILSNAYRQLENKALIGY